MCMISRSINVLCAKKKENLLKRLGSFWLRWPGMASSKPFKPMFVGLIEHIHLTLTRVILCFCQVARI